MTEPICYDLKYPFSKLAPSSGLGCGKHAHLLSVGIGLHGSETHTYAVRAFSREAFYKLKLSERFFEHGEFWRKVVVRVLWTHVIRSADARREVSRA